jgi:hypothetical protein
MTSASINPGTRKLILELLQTQAQTPTDLLHSLLEKQLSPNEIQDTLALLLDTGVIEMGADRRLHPAEVAA